MPRADLRPDDPRRIGPYDLLARLGAGGMGVVYLATDPDGAPVALKLVRPEHADDPTFRARFAREVATLRRVSGPGVVRLSDADPEGAQPYLVTELVDGPSLAEVVAHRGPLAGEELRELAAALAEALVSLHRSGVVHRDLKPSNVLLGPHGPRLIDFGIAAAAESTSLTRTGHVVGSALWMSPEQAQGEPATPRSDVFAWGATVAFAATGRAPFGEGQPAAVAYRVVHDEADTTGVPASLIAVVDEALTKDPIRRPDAAAVLDAVRTGGRSLRAVAGAEATRTISAVPGPVHGAVGQATAAFAALVDTAERSAEHPLGDRARSVLVRAAVAVSAVLLVVAAAAQLLAGGVTSDAAAAGRTQPTGAERAPTPAAAWDGVVADLPAGTAATGVLAGDPERAATGTGPELRVWTWDGAAWRAGEPLPLPGDVDGPDALVETALTGSIPPVVLVRLAGDRGAVVSVEAGGRLVPFATPTGSLVRSVAGPVVDGDRVSGAVDVGAGRITWRFEPDVGGFVVEQGPPAPAPPESTLAGDVPPDDADDDRADQGGDGGEGNGGEGNGGEGNGGEGNGGEGNGGEGNRGAGRGKGRD